MAINGVGHGPIIRANLESRVRKSGKLFARIWKATTLIRPATRALIGDFDFPHCSQLAVRWRLALAASGQPSGNVVGMAYVVARRGGRFEIRESFHTSRGPRSRTLVGFDVLTDDILVAAARRAQRPFDAEAVIRSGRRAGVRVGIATSGADRARDRFLTGSKSMASRLGESPSIGARADAGTALLELLGFADMVA